MIENLINKITLGDSLEILKKLPDNCVDLLLTDPPYGINAESGTGRSLRLNKNIIKNKGWDSGIPSQEFFEEMLRVSKNQVIWGGNYFPYIWQKPCRGPIIWDKLNAGRDFADCELAWTSFDTVARIYQLRVHNADAVRFHPTQKPLKLFKHCLSRFAKEGDLILDCFSGSGTTALACHDMKMNYICIEKDSDYHAKSVERLAEHQKQLTLF